MGRGIRTRILDLRITALDEDGHGTAVDSEKTYGVPRTLPGERAVVEALRAGRSPARLSVLELHDPNPHRVTPRCAAAAYCGGCALQHLDEDAQRAHKQATLLELLATQGVIPEQVEAPLHAGSYLYRRRARLGVKAVKGKGRVLVGFRELDGRYIALLDRCEILAEPFDGMLLPLATLIDGLTVRDRVPQVEVARGDDAMALTLRVLDPPTEDDIDKLREFGEQWSVILLLQPGNYDTVHTLDGATPPLLHYELPSQRLRLAFSPFGFVQVHAAGNAALVDRVLDWAGPLAGARVADLFCGLGNFTLPLARRAARVVGVEADAALLELAAHNAAANELYNVEFQTADLFQTAADDVAAQTWDLIVLDPPRSGAERLCKTLSPATAPRVLYVSCGPKSFARDAAALVSKGYRLTRLGIADLFPHTAHWESYGLFEG